MQIWRRLQDLLEVVFEVLHHDENVVLFKAVDVDEVIYLAAEAATLVSDFFEVPHDLDFPHHFDAVVLGGVVVADKFDGDGLSGGEAPSLHHFAVGSLANNALELVAFGKVRPNLCAPLGRFLVAERL